jgi:hypothetical protein
MALPSDQWGCCSCDAAVGMLHIECLNAVDERTAVSVANAYGSGLSVAQSSGMFLLGAQGYGLCLYPSSVDFFYRAIALTVL